MTIEILRNKLKKLQETNPDVHISLNFRSPKLVLDNAPAQITGVYNHIFRVKETSRGVVRSHSLQLTDLLTGRVKVHELEL